MKIIMVKIVTIELELQIATNAKTLPHPSQFREWVSVALWGRVEHTELTIRIVDEEEMIELNEKYRDKKGPTNVLSFPAEIDPAFELPILGDIVICASIIEKEAEDQDKEILSHWALMVVHGALHLLKFDHQTKDEALEMETLETEILTKLGFPPPYGKKIET
jgi:probable rRNA maturation factor